MKFIKIVLILMGTILLLTGCSYKADVKAGFAGSKELFVGVSEWPIDPIKIQIRKENNLAYKCNGVFTKGDVSGGTINDGKFYLKCLNGEIIDGNWYSPNGMNNVIAQGQNKYGKKFYMITGTELNKFPSLENKLHRQIFGKDKIKKKVKNSIQKPSYNSSSRYMAVNSSNNVIETSIDGEFEGWEGETVVKLLNGQIWQQSSYHYHYHYAYMPNVLIYRANGGYKMKVDGTDMAVSVIRLK